MGRSAALLCLVTLVQAPHVHLSDGWAQARLMQAVFGAQARLMRPECQRVVADFQDGEGRPLLERLNATGMTAPEYLEKKVWFVDGDDTPRCRRSPRVAAFTTPGHHVVKICSARFSRAFERQPVAAEMLVIHEMLHTLGLGEKPPSSAVITATVTKRCGRNKRRRLKNGAASATMSHA
jgi:hypothetical protein